MTDRSNITRPAFVLFAMVVTAACTSSTSPTSDVARRTSAITMGSDDDVGLLLLEADSVAPLALRTAPLDTSALQATLRLIGFGSTSVDDASTRRKRTGTAVIDEIADTKFRAHGAPSLTCFNDSGAPSLLTLNGVEQVAGVTTSGDSNCVSRHCDRPRDAPLRS